MTAPLDLTGQRFGRLVAIDWKSGGATTGRIWRCRCDCGNETDVRRRDLKTGNTGSCGCLHRTINGEFGSPEYLSWRSMKARCGNPNATGFKNYGARGITFCERWRDFNAFLADMGRRPSPRHSLDRWPDADGNYEPTNCRWATALEQRHNRRAA